jgi:hypothetical protein
VGDNVTRKEKALRGNELNVTRWFSEWLPDPPVFGPITNALNAWIETEPERAWLFILLLIERAPSEHALQCIAAGPLEDLLVQHGAIFIDRVEHSAQTDQRFKRCLGNVWGHIGLNPEIHRRVKAASAAS